MSDAISRLRESLADEPDAWSPPLRLIAEALLPPAPSDGTRWATMNVNDSVRVRLTPRGRAIAEEAGRLDGLASGNAYRAQIDAAGWSEWQMWELAQVFGRHLRNGAALCFETEIQVEVRR